MAPWSPIRYLFSRFLLQWFSEQSYVCVRAANNCIEAFTGEIANCGVDVFPKGEFFKFLFLKLQLLRYLFTCPLMPGCARCLLSFSHSSPCLFWVLGSKDPAAHCLPFNGQLLWSLIHGCDSHMFCSECSCSLVKATGLSSSSFHVEGNAWESCPHPNCSDGLSQHVLLYPVPDINTLSTPLLATISPLVHLSLEF